jgi:hypothetical protein
VKLRAEGLDEATNRVLVAATDRVEQLLLRRGRVYARRGHGSGD